MTRLILNADDYGLTPGVNQAVGELCREHVLTSATLMASGAAFAQAVALRPTELGVGCHVQLVDGQSTLPLSNIPTLAAPGGKSLRTTLGAFVRDLTLGRIRAEEIEAEATAQIQALQSAGVNVTHVDTHKHTHMFPGVYRPLLRAASACRVRAIRNPFEPAWSIQATAAAGQPVPLVRRMQVGTLARLSGGYLKAVQQAGLRTTQGALGVLATGTLNSAVLRSLLSALPAGDWELVLHPGYPDEALGQVRTRLRGSRAVEAEALREGIPALASSVQLINFSQL